MFRTLVDKIEQEYIAEKDYKSLPMLNNNWILLSKIYDGASEREKSMICDYMISKWDTLFRYWKTDKDEKYGKGKWKKYFE